VSWLLGGWTPLPIVVVPGFGLGLDLACLYNSAVIRCEYEGL